MFMVVTDGGTRVYAGESGKGMTEDEAAASVKDRNERAEQMDLAVRYESAAYTEPVV